MKLDKLLPNRKEWFLVQDSNSGIPIVPPAEREVLRGQLSKVLSYRLIVNGDLGPKEIRRLIKMLEAQKDILSEDCAGY